MMIYKVWFSHSKTTLSGHQYRNIDWTLVEAESAEEAKKEAKQWVRKNRFASGCTDHIKILEVR